MVPVNMGCHHRHRLVCQFPDCLRYIADSETGIYQQTSVTAIQQIAVGLLPMPVFADNSGIVPCAVDGKPFLHNNPLLVFAYIKVVAASVVVLPE